MRCLLPTLLAILACSAFAADEAAVPLKPFRTQPTPAARTTYVVAEGDTLFSIARKFERDPKLIQWLNRFDNADVLPVGKVLFVGDATATR